VEKVAKTPFALCEVLENSPGVLVPAVHRTGRGRQASGLSGLARPPSARPSVAWLPAEALKVVFAVSAGNDLDPADSNPNLPFGLGPLLGSSALFDGNDFQTGRTHGVTFSYTLTFVPGFIPAPAAGCVALLAGGMCISSRRR
jgi:hypothetical protein